jgi:glucose/arabinose dehydrogenase
MTTYLRTLLPAGRGRAARRGRSLSLALSVALVLGSLAALLAATAPAASAATLPAGFQESIVFSGLQNPTVVRFAPDGRVFVAEKRGVIKVFDSLTDTTPDVFADLNVNVYNFWDRGLLGMALAPNFPTSPYVYVLYAYDHELGSSTPAPRWGTPGVYSDPCPTPPGATGDGCVVSGRLSRLQAAGNVMTGPEQVLVEDWCQQYPSHSVGAVEFGRDGALYASGGDGASFTFVDHGQAGSPVNPCGDPMGGAGTGDDEGGALRSQDLRTTGDPVSLDGTIIRIDPATGAAVPDNPLAANADPNARRIVAYGQRNPFRFTFRPNTGELWAGDVGWNDWEEINRIPNPTAGVTNLGWPCYEGNPASPVTTARTSTSARTCMARRARSPPRTTPTTTPAGSSPTRPARPAAPRSPGCSSSSPRAAPTPRSTRTRCSSPTTHATASGPCSRAGTATRPRG